MSSERRAILFLVLLLAALGCNQKNSNVRVEKPIPAAAPVTVSQPVAMPAKLPPPTSADAEAALQRVFGDTLVMDHKAAQPFIVGDFNGDDSEDLAVIARPAPGKLNEVNAELADWIVQDADRFYIAPNGKSKVVVPEMEKPKIVAGEPVLAIIHGYGPEGWRNAAARQAYIVKHAAATFVGTAPSISRKSIRLMRLPVRTEIIEQVRDKQRGFLFWTGAEYAWHPEKG
jgi:hypothetical protein